MTLAQAGSGSYLPEPPAKLGGDMRGIKSIQIKIGVYLITIITVILGLFGSYQYLTVKADLTTGLHELANVSASRLGEQLVEPLWNYDPPQIENMLRSYMADKRCYALLVFDPSDKIVKGLQRDGTGQIVPATEPVSGNLMTSRQEIARDTKKLGRIEAYVTSQFMDERLRQEILKISLTVIVLDLALLGFLIVALRRLLIRPINLLLTSTSAITQGDFRQTIQIRQDDEIGRLAAEFRKMIAYMQDMANAATRIAEGDLRQTIAPRSAQDILGNAFQRMSNYLEQIANAAETLAKGDLRQEIQLRTDNDLLGRTFRNMSTRLNEIVLGVKAAAESVASGSQDLNRTAEQMSQGTNQQAAAAEEVSSSMEEMVANIRQNMENAQMTEKIALESSADAEKGGIAVAQTIEAMQAIAERISIIQEIASQTNMLSLNATIEASKAQDFGKGFAVVASEVRELARRTRQAAEEINQLVRSCEVVSEEAGTILQRLVPNSRRTAELVQEISAASSEQYTGAEQINKAIQQLDTVIQENAAMTEEMASAAEELASQSAHLQEAMAFFTAREVRQSPLEQAQETTLMDSLHDLLAAPAVDEQQLAHLITTIIALKQKGKESDHSPKENRVRKPDAEGRTSPEKRTETTMTTNIGPDEIDADFERF